MLLPARSLQNVAAIQAQGLVQMASYYVNMSGDGSSAITSAVGGGGMGIPGGTNGRQGSRSFAGTPVSAARQQQTMRQPCFAACRQHGGVRARADSRPDAAACWLQLEPILDGNETADAMDEPNAVTVAKGDNAV